MGSLAVIGGGSLGLLLAGRLAAAGRDATVVTRTAEQAAKLADEGITIEEAHGGGSVPATVKAPVRAASLDEASALDKDGIALLAVKQTALTEPFLARLAELVPAGGTVVPFQNGVGHLERLRAALPGRTLLPAVTTEGALREGPTTVRHTGRGDVRLGEWDFGPGGDGASDDGPSQDRLRADLEECERFLTEAGFSVILSNELGEAVLRKLLANAVINPLTAILRIRNGELPATPDRLRLMRDLFDETYGILGGEGLKDDREASWQAVLAICERTSRNESSMLQDVRAGRETEIDAINGEVCRMAARQGMRSPWNEAVAALVRATSNG